MVETAIADEVRALLLLLAVLPSVQDVAEHGPYAAVRRVAERRTLRLGLRGGPSVLVRLTGASCLVDPDPVTGSGVATGDVLWLEPRQIDGLFDEEAPPEGDRDLDMVPPELIVLIRRAVSCWNAPEALRADPGSPELCTRVALTTAVFAVPVLLAHDSKASAFRGAFAAQGALALQVAPDGPCAGLRFQSGHMRPFRGDVDDPSALVRLHGSETANAFLRSRLNIPAAVARGDIEMWGYIPVIDALTLVLERLGKYLRPERSR
jgi:hypothetical protein